MKKLLIMTAVVLSAVRAKGQAQEIEQLKLNLEKLVQLKLMLSQMKQGYQTLQSGYNSVRDAAKGNFNLHRTYLDGLLQVSEKVRNSPSLQRLLSNHELVKNEFKNWLQRITATGLFNLQELFGMKSSYQSIADVCSADLAQIQLLIAPGSLRMNDGERMAVIESLAESSDQQLASVRQLIKEQTDIAMRRAQAKRDMQALRKLYGLQ